MFAIHARYRGREVRRADLVRRSAAALSTLEGVGEFELLGVEDICAVIASAQAATDTTMALLAAGDWAVGIGISARAERAKDIAGAALGKHARSGTVKVRIDARGGEAAARATDVAAVFTLLGHVLAKRSPEGREATALMRSGLNQNEAARELGISKQAMSQRLQAAGWQAETAGWELAVHMLERA
ncbi:MarR family transcriptional regulator [Corynebacterium sp.]|uniref:MarR family transcriptional regulator n=1 Tax=Corynebacterium sp. TaxID=1720 RepID=UPI0026DD82D1|nr:MarR family transcriptional regulator [Corynebacterium sp.]MDO5077435.1 MarR family transcriptional regulator [Corynebacterium sp.]